MYAALAYDRDHSERDLSDDEPDDLEEYYLSEKFLEAQDAEEEKLYPLMKSGRKTRLVEVGETGLTRSRDRGYNYIDSSWKRHRRTKWRRQQSGYILPAEMRA